MTKRDEIIDNLKKDIAEEKEKIERLEKSVRQHLSKSRERSHEIVEIHKHSNIPGWLAGLVFGAVIGAFIGPHGVLIFSIIGFLIGILYDNGYRLCLIKK